MPAHLRARADTTPHGVPLDADRAIRKLAAAQHGVVARRQLLRAGVAAHVIDLRVWKAVLSRLFKGVYRAGPAPTAREREMAAVLACGDTAVFSHRSAAELWQLLPSRQEGSPVDVSVRGSVRRPGRGVRVRRSADLSEGDVTVLDGIRVTTPERTLLDLGTAVGARELEQAAAEAERRRLIDLTVLVARLARSPRRPGTRLLRAVLAQDGGPVFLRSEAEARFLVLVRKAGLTAPEANVRLHGHEVDFLWRAARLVVEIDGAAYHTHPAARERDHLRDGGLVAVGYRVMRVTWHQITKEPEALLVRLGRALRTGA